MQTPSLRPRAALAVVLMFGMSAAATAQQATRHVVAGDNVAIYNLVGTLRLAGGTGSDVVVEVTRGGDDAGQLRVATGPIRGRHTLRVLYPEGDVVYGDQEGFWGSTEIRVREDGTFGDDVRRRGWFGDGHVVRIKGRGRGVEAYADLKISLPPGKRIAVYLAVGKAVVSNVDGDILVDVASASITAERTRGTLTLDTGSGDIRLTDAQGDITLDTGSGSVSVATAGGSRLLIDTGSGDVSATDIDVQDLNIDTGSGGVDLRRAKAATIRIDTGSGDVDVALLSDVESLDIDTGSGEVTLMVPESLGAEIEIGTGSGDIDLGFPVQVRRIESDHVTGQIGDGRGRIVIETGSGTVRLVRS